jgi:hypothetical protein
MNRIRRVGGQSPFLVYKIDWLAFLTLIIGAAIYWQAWPIMRVSGQAQIDDRARDGLWQEIARRELIAFPLGVAPTRHARAVRLNQRALQEVLRKAPLENTRALDESQCLLSLPLPDGKFARFRIEESPTMEPALAAKFPEIKSYRGVGMDDSSMQMRFDWSPRGLHALLLSNEKPISVEPLRNNDDTAYVSYYGQDAIKPPDFECLVEQVPGEPLRQWGASSRRLLSHSAMCGATSASQLPRRSNTHKRQTWAAGRWRARWLRSTLG